VLIEELLPSRTGQAGRPFSDPRVMVEGIIYRYRCRIAWRDLPAVFGPWQTVWTWHRRLAGDGTWDQILDRLLTQADAEGLIEWSVSVDSTIARAHQHATNLTRVTGGAGSLSSCVCKCVVLGGSSAALQKVYVAEGTVDVTGVPAVISDLLLVRSSGAVTEPAPDTATSRLLAHARTAPGGR